MKKPPPGAKLLRKAGLARSAETQAKALRRTRRQHALEMAQDYAEAIAELTAAHGEARAVDLAHRFGVTHVTVTRTLERLRRDGYITTRPYRAVFLTDEGSKLAEESRQRHEIVLEFLRKLGVSEDIAQSDAEGIEHHVSPETLALFKKFTGGR